MKTIKEALFGLVGGVIAMITALFVVFKAFSFIGRLFLGLFLQGYDEAKQNKQK